MVHVHTIKVEKEDKILAGLEPVLIKAFFLG
jgi:hypothetical protein